ncbi:proton channel OtopLc-like [Thrips palmi]|uniref:Proton channel OtopLc-like n=1 Tax=Thrips palmi TaxID=161013 RepID=A0A6P8Z8M8_THRPL|nr:proton channel OtopLc-like [Thrips palmi]
MRDRPGHRGLRGLGDGDRDRERREPFKDLKDFKDLRDLRGHFPRRLRDPWRDTRRNLTQILSCVYAVFIVTLGVVVYISSLVAGKSPVLAEAFSLYLVGLGLLYLVFLYTDIRRYLNRIKARQAFILASGTSMTTSPKASPRTSLTPPRPRPVQPVPHDYCFSDASHAASFYLKVGAAGFCFGHLVHSSLLLAYQAMFLLQDPDEFYKCASPATLVLDVLYPVYSFLQLFFIFKYSNVIINRCEELARFALMHCLSSSLCFWVWTILRETMDSLAHYDHHDHPEHLEQPDDPLLDYDTDYPSPVFMNASSLGSSECRGSTQLSTVLDSLSPYLYPFTIEYSILVVGVLFVIWQNIGTCSNAAPDMSPQSGFVSNVVLHADCHSANKGLFAGLIVLVGAAISIILFLLAMADSEYMEVGLTVNSVTEVALLALMTVAVMVAYCRLAKLDVVRATSSSCLLDHLLLFLCIPAFFLYAIFSIVPALEQRSYLSITTILLQVAQVLVQTPFIMDGMRRCSNCVKLRLQKPGRELVTFLIVCNVALWITDTFEIKSVDARDHRADYYGRVLWTMISHATVPLTMLYRFHSSGCLVHIWKSAYEADKQH